MSGDYRLGDFVYAGHYALLHRVLTEHHPRGWALEFGVGGGESSRLIASHMPVVGFDSFKGLPEDWREGFPAGMFAQDIIPYIENAYCVVGLFEDILPGYRFPDFGLVHVDCDLYSSTKTVLEHVGPLLRPGCFVVFDEWHGYEGCERHEQRAWREFAGRSGVQWWVVGHSFQQWGIQIV